MTEVFVKVLQIEAEALKELKMDLEHAEKVREIKKVQKRLGWTVNFERSLLSIVFINILYMKMLYFIDVNFLIVKLMYDYS